MLPVELIESYCRLNVGHGNEVKVVGKAPLLWAAMVFLTGWSAGASGDSVAPYPELYIAVADGNSADLRPSDDARVVAMLAERSAALSKNEGLVLVVVTHGWFERYNWTREMALAMERRAGGSTVICGCFEWRALARRVNPVDAARAATQTAGPLLGDKILKLSLEWDHVHLIGHSAGAWVISEASEAVARYTKAPIHLTFLDAYVPPFWDQGRLGKVAEDPNVAYWADHYFTRDLTLGATEKPLTHAHNVDLTRVDPGIKDHRLPHYWYHGTIIGQYDENQRYAGKELWYRANGVRYGFDRSLEAGLRNWRQNQKLQMGAEAIEITPDRPPAWLENLANLFR